MAIARSARSAGWCALLAALLGSLACSGAKRTPMVQKPRSIVVAPADNHSVELNASSVYRSTVAQPLAERGYYVFPVMLTDAVLLDLGIVDPGMAHELPAQRYGELFGADAVLFVSIVDWSNRWILLDAQTTVGLEMQMFDTRTGTLIWERQVAATVATNGGGGNLIVAAITAAVVYGLNEMSDTEHRPVAALANQLAFWDTTYGLPTGHYREAAEKAKKAQHR